MIWEYGYFRFTFVVDTKGTIPSSVLHWYLQGGLWWVHSCFVQVQYIILLFQLFDSRDLSWARDKRYES